MVPETLLQARTELCRSLTAHGARNPFAGTHGAQAAGKPHALDGGLRDGLVGGPHWALCQRRLQQEDPRVGAAGVGTGPVWKGTADCDSAAPGFMQEDARICFKSRVAPRPTMRSRCTACMHHAHGPVLRSCAR
eukprot:364326-Chlamydomonas_euryale.AAC.20